MVLLLKLSGNFTLLQFRLNLFLRYNPRTNQTHKMAPMLNPRLDFYAVHYNGFIYVFGGKNQYGPMRLCEKYDISQNKWTALPSLPEATAHMAGALSVDEGKNLIRKENDSKIKLRIGNPIRWLYKARSFPTGLPIRFEMSKICSNAENDVSSGRAYHGHCDN